MGWDGMARDEKVTRVVGCRVDKVGQGKAWEGQGDGKRQGHGVNDKGGANRNLK